jgi:hypothetical protein
MREEGLIPVLLHGESYQKAINSGSA